MSVNKKRVLIVCLVFFIAFFLAGVIFHAMKPEEKEGLVFPKGTMSDSLFDSQNTTYKQVKEFSETYAFSHIPYTVDRFSGDGAIVDTGCIFPYKDTGYRFYFSEIRKDADFFHTIKKQYGTGVLYEYDPELSYVEDIYVQNGFVNGFSGSYTISKFVMDDGETQKKEYLFGYYLEVPNYDYNMLIAVGTQVESSQIFANAKAILDQLVFTIKYNTSIERRLLDEASKNVKNAESVAESESTSSGYVVSEVDNSGNNQNQSRVEVYNQSTNTSTYTSVNDGNSQQVGMNDLEGYTEQNYATFLSATSDDMVVNVYWEGENVADIELVCSPENTVYQTDKIVDGVAQFYVGPLVDGEYVIYVLAESTTSLKAEMINNNTGEVTQLSLITISQS